MVKFEGMELLNTLVLNKLTVIFDNLFDNSSDINALTNGLRKIQPQKL